MKKIAVIGHGYVGEAVGRFFKDHYQVMVRDIKYEEQRPEAPRTQFFLGASKEDINSCDMAVIAVPTPMKDDGEVDLTFVNEVFSWLKVPLVLIKSAIPPGTTDKLCSMYGMNICVSPEYLGEGKYVVPWWKDQGYPHPTDMKYHDFQIFGGRRETTKGVLEFFKKVTGPNVKYIQTDAITSEVCKYMENSWGATKVIFCNTFAKIAEVFGVDYNELRELFLLDGRVERMHTVVFEDNRGFGGKCWPKDVNGIIKQSEKAGYSPELLKAVLSVNKQLRNE